MSASFRAHAVRRSMAGVVIGLVASVALSRADGPAEQATPRKTPLVLSSMAGSDLYEFYCASCHGRDGKGGGPTAAALKTPPSDLTTLSTRSGGMFPRQRVEDYVTGAGEVVSHGSQDMPVWGPIFNALEPNEAANRVRIANIVDYIQSVQQRE
jgi:mono/diheme cytochrome c family protein